MQPYTHTPSAGWWECSAHPPCTPCNQERAQERSLVRRSIRSLRFMYCTQRIPYTHMRTHTLALTHTHTHIHTQTHAHTHTRARTHTRTHTVHTHFTDTTPTQTHTRARARAAQHGKVQHIHTCIPCSLAWGNMRPSAHLSRRRTPCPTTRTCAPRPPTAHAPSRTPSPTHPRAEALPSSAARLPSPHPL